MIGEAGKRTFRLVAERGATTVSLWLEKEQLQSVAVLVEQHLASSGRGQVRQERALLTLAARFPGRPTVDFKAGRMSLGYDQRKETFALAAEEIAETDERGQQVTWEMGVAQARALCAKIAEIVAAGRPRCPLCGAPLEGKHVCPLSNGHAY